MEALLKLVHEDFELLVSCNSYDRIYRKAAECMRVEQDSEALLSYYIWDGDKAVLTFRGISIEKGAYVPSVFFENTDYRKRLSKYIFYSSFSLLTFATKK